MAEEDVVRTISRVLKYSEYTSNLFTNKKATAVYVINFCISAILMP